MMNTVAHIKLRLPKREPVRSSVDEDEVYEMIDFREVDQKPCSKRVSRFVSSQNSPSISKTTRKHCVKFANSEEHSLKRLYMLMMSLSSLMMLLLTRKL